MKCLHSQKTTARLAPLKHAWETIRILFLCFWGGISGLFSGANWLLVSGIVIPPACRWATLDEAPKMSEALHSKNHSTSWWFQYI